MKSQVYTMLLRSLVMPYYQSNAGFFFVVIVFTFGLLRPVEHIALITYILHSTFLLYLLFALWTLYTLKTIQYIKQALKQPQHAFIYHFSLYPFYIRLAGLLLMQISLWQPVLLYAAFIVYVAFSTALVTPLFWIALFCCISLAGTAVLYNYWLLNPDPDKKQTPITRLIHTHFTTPYSFYFLGFLLDEHKVLVFLSKTFSCAMITGIIRLYAIEDYNMVVLSLGMLAGVAGNAVISYQMQQFEQVQLQFIKNMPLSVGWRFLRMAGIYTILLLPEMAICMRYLLPSAGFWNIAGLMFFGLSLLVLLHSYLSRETLSQESFIRRLFFITLLFFLLILFRIQLIWLTAFNWILAYYLYRKYFYDYEQIVLAEE